MKKSIFRILYSVLFLCSILCCYAQDQTILVTPAQTISTCKKDSLLEGDYVKFKVVDGKGVIPNNTIIQGIVRTIEDNGFYGKEAQAVIQNFKCDGYKIVGEIYLQGSLHKTANEFANGFSSDFPLWVRGGEINLKPNEKEFILYVRE